jgi:hypothetical protein
MKSRFRLALLVLLTASPMFAACKTISDTIEPPSLADRDATLERLDRARDMAIENRIAAPYHEEKEVWQKVLELLGDYRDEVAAKAHELRANGAR